MPNRTTRDYKGPTMLSTVQAALDAALQDDEEMHFDAMYVYILLLYYSYLLLIHRNFSVTTSGGSKRHRSRRGKGKDSLKADQPRPPLPGGGAQTLNSGASGSSGLGDNETFPTSRGLVSRPVRFA